MKTGNRNPESFGNWRGDLKDWAFLGLLPTPTARDYRSGFKKDSEAFKTRKQHSRGVNLHEDIQRTIGQNFQLNPRFVMEMMGFPPDWTELPFLNGETNPLKQEETP